jgi:hypothetical protein
MQFLNAIAMFAAGLGAGVILGMYIGERVWRPHADEMAKIWKDHSEWVRDHYQKRIDSMRSNYPRV